MVKSIHGSNENEVECTGFKGKSNNNNVEFTGSKGKSDNNNVDSSKKDLKESLKEMVDMRVKLLKHADEYGDEYGWDKYGQDPVDFPSGKDVKTSDDLAEWVDDFSDWQKQQEKLDEIANKERREAEAKEAEERTKEETARLEFVKKINAKKQADALAEANEEAHEKSVKEILKLEASESTPTSVDASTPVVTTVSETPTTVQPRIDLSMVPIRRQSA